MAVMDDSEGFVGRRIKLRDLRVFLAVVRAQSMAKAASQLGVSQPAVSAVIAGLEHSLRVRLFDRNARGVELTVYGKALFTRSRGAFDELRQGIRDIEGIADAGGGSVRIGCAETIAAILPPIVRQFSKHYPRAVLQVDQVVTPTLDLPQLRDRYLDFVLARIGRPLAEDASARDFDVELLFDDRLVIVAGTRSPWARRRHIELEELIDEPWILPPPDAWNTTMLNDAFQTKGLKMPRTCLLTYSVHLRTNLLAEGNFITVLPRSILELYAARYSFKELPVDFPVRTWPVAVVTVKNRTLSPVVHRFIEHVRAYTKSLASTPVRKKRSTRRS
jgi:DNA-binding transcriptional LysR family regulator